jgi:hypothetical protein
LICDLKEVVLAELFSSEEEPGEQRSFEWTDDGTTERSETNKGRTHPHLYIKPERAARERERRSKIEAGSEDENV